MRYMDENPPIHMDEGYFMDEDDGSQTGRSHKMAQVSLNLYNITDEQLLKDSNNYYTGINGNSKYANTSPTPAQYLAMINDADNKSKASDIANAAAKAATEAKNAAFTVLHDGTARLAKSVESISGGNAVEIKSVNMNVKADKTPVGDLPQVQNVHVSLGDMPGSNDVQWDNLPRGVQTYIVQKGTAPDGTWTQVYVGKKSSCTVMDSVSGAQNWFRVCASGANGAGPWSVPVPGRAA